MCGIAGIAFRQAANRHVAQTLGQMASLIKHRGPDGEGFLLAHQTAALPFAGLSDQRFERTDLPYIPTRRISEPLPGATLGFAHRRLSIIDLSDGGHQPMCSRDETLWITFNGEIYNYIELREELKGLGHAFISESDTEVILCAYRQWGRDCVQRFNGMWAFCIYDVQKQVLFASRDRLGVKPFYYVSNNECFAFASEQKALAGAGLVKAQAGHKALHSYLVNGLLENEHNNFFEGITELWPGHNLTYNIASGDIALEKYFHLGECLSLENDRLSEAQLVEKINTVLENAIRIRLRSDVEVGTCLSGGIDSSVLAAVISDITQQPLYCFTSVFRNRPINEERYADLVAATVNARHVKTEPTLDGFISEVDSLVYSQDVPIWSTSTYAQYKVMELAKQSHIKVVLDGQGADELFAGYHHHFIARWNSFMKQGKLLTALTDMNATRKTISDPFLFYAKESVKSHYNVERANADFLLIKEFVGSHEVQNPAHYKSDINQQLLSDIYDTRLKSFLKCEDRCGMWHSVESRTPFSDDIELMKLLFSFKANKKIKNGVSKYLLREASKHRLPAGIYARYDKKGFETPMQEWMVAMRPRLLSEIKNAGFEFVNYTNLERTDANDAAQNRLLFKLFILARWHRVFA